MTDHRGQGERQSDVPLVELVDRLLNRGVVLVGEATIAVSGVDLVYLGLSVVLSATDAIERPAGSAELGS